MDYLHIQADNPWQNYYIKFAVNMLALQVNAIPLTVLYCSFLNFECVARVRGCSCGLDSFLTYVLFSHFAYCELCRFFASQFPICTVSWCLESTTPLKFYTAHFETL